MAGQFNNASVKVLAHPDGFDAPTDVVMCVVRRNTMRLATKNRQATPTIVDGVTAVVHTEPGRYVDVITDGGTWSLEIVGRPGCKPCAARRAAVRAGQ